MTDAKAKRIKELERELATLKAPARLNFQQTIDAMSNALLSNALHVGGVSTLLVVQIDANTWGAVREVSLRPKAANGQGWQEDAIVLHVDLDSGTESDCQ